MVVNTTKKRKQDNEIEDSRWGRQLEKPVTSGGVP